MASLKSTNSTPDNWLNSAVAGAKNRKHLEDLVEGANNRSFSGSGRVINADEVKLIIAVPKAKLSEFANFESFIHNSGINGVRNIKVEVISIDQVLAI